MNNFSAIGFLHEIVGENTRRVQIALPGFNDDGENTTDIYIKYWAGGAKNYMTLMADNSHVAFQGYLDYDKNFGTIVVVQLIYCLRKYNEDSKTV